MSTHQKPTLTLIQGGKGEHEPKTRYVINPLFSVASGARTQKVISDPRLKNDTLDTIADYRNDLAKQLTTSAEKVNPDAALLEITKVTMDSMEKCPSLWIDAIALESVLWINKNQESGRLTLDAFDTKAGISLLAERIVQPDHLIQAITGDTKASTKAIPHLMALLKEVDHLPDMPFNSYKMVFMSTISSFRDETTLEAQLHP
ncbi:MAG: hypothetical protein IT559_06390 [Alphaproteobacteria bacterium]|nr:hypothetical protein [Alphaproteobacteria bacterium]